MPEVAGDAALLVDPYRVEDIADAIRRLACDEGLREDFAARGRQRASRFTWEAAVGRTWNVYRKVLGSRG